VKTSSIERRWNGWRDRSAATSISTLPGDPASKADCTPTGPAHELEAPQPPQPRLSPEVPRHEPLSNPELSAFRGFRDTKSSIDLRPVFHHKDERIRAHVQLCWLALLILRVAEVELGDTWRNIRDELDRLHLITLRTTDGTLAQRSELTARHKEILHRLHLPEPARFYDFTPLTD
jgi:hypothetical protein